jgi:hypothetical protein
MPVKKNVVFSSFKHVYLAGECQPGRTILKMNDRMGGESDDRQKNFYKTC